MALIIPDESEPTFIATHPSFDDKLIELDTSYERGLITNQTYFRERRKLFSTETQRLLSLRV